MQRRCFWKVGKKTKSDAARVLTSNCFLFPALGLPLCILIGIDLVELLPPKEIGDIVFFILGICASLFCAWLAVMMCYRFRIDEKGVTVQRLFYQRVFLWGDIKEVIISARTTSDRTVESAIFCKEIQRPYIRPKPETIDIGKKKLSLCIDLDSKEYPADKLYAYINKQQFLKFANSQELVVHYDAASLRSLKSKKWRKANK